MKKNTKKTEIVPPDTTIKIETKVNIADALYLSIDQIGAKRVVMSLLSICLRNTLEKSVFLSSLLATPKDEEQADVTAALYYLKHNWKECSDKGMKLLEKKTKEAYGKQANSSM